MNILVDINHPQDVHMFKNFIWQMEKRGHNITINASQKSVSLELLDSYHLPYNNLGTYGTSTISKLVKLPILDLRGYLAIRKKNIDLIIGSNNIRGAHISKIINKPSILITGTEHNRLQQIISIPFSTAVITAENFQKDFGKKQVRFPGFYELAYLHKNYFTPDPSILKLLKLSENDNIIILRLVDWSATHDIGQGGFKNLEYVIDNLKGYGNIFLSSEVKNEKYKKYELKIPPEKYHDLLYYSTLYIGEGGSSASESALLGTPAIFINSLTCGYLEELETKYHLVKNIHDTSLSEEYLCKCATDLLKKYNLKKEGRLIREKIMRENIDTTQFFIDYVEKYASKHKIS